MVSLFFSLSYYQLSTTTSAKRGSHELCRNYGDIKQPIDSKPKQEYSIPNESDRRFPKAEGGSYALRDSRFLRYAASWLRHHRLRGLLGGRRVFRRRRRYGASAHGICFHQGGITHNPTHTEALRKWSFFFVLLQSCRQPNQQGKGGLIMKIPCIENFSHRLGHVNAIITTCLNTRERT